MLHATLGPLANSWDIRQLAVNHQGAQVDTGWRILPNPNIGDSYGIQQIPPLVDDFRPDALFVFNSFLNLPRYWEAPARLGSSRPALVAQCPVLGEAADPRLVARLAFFDCVVVLSETVRLHFSNCLDHCLRSGFIDRVPRLEVIPHGLDAGIFHPLGDRRAARAGFPGLCDLPDDAFVILNANRNQPRKRIDITLEGFARFARDKPPNVFLYLHMGETPDGSGLRTLIQQLGLGERVLLTTPEPGGHPRLDDRALNRLYNACDVGLNTASAEGWGMISFEHAATGAAQIVPGAWVCGEIWHGNAELLDAATEQPAPARYTRETVLAADSVAAAMQRLYVDPAYRSRMAERAAALAGAANFQWSSIAAHWHALLHEMVLSRRPSSCNTAHNPAVDGIQLNQ